jgi:hypothetical protein
LDLGADEKAPGSWRFFYARGAYQGIRYGTAKKIDERKCFRCGSVNVRTVFELIGETCPKCKVGIVQEIFTGVIS